MTRDRGLHRYSQAVPAPTSDLPRSIELGGRRVEVSEVFWSYWYLASERQAIFFRRLDGQPAPWTDDDVLQKYRFTNAYRASDRVSQYLIQHVIYGDDYEPRDVVLRVLLFKIFNRVETWECIAEAVGDVRASCFDARVIGEILSDRFDAGYKIYSAAYIMPSPGLGHERKHLNHLELLERMLRDDSLATIADARSLRELYERLLAVPSFGHFLAFQYAIDLNYSPCFDFSEMDHVVAGPGAIRGLAKCFTDTAGLEPEDLIRGVAEQSEEFFRRAGVEFSDLWGRPLQLIDCQNLFCEVDKYARVVHPGVGGRGPARIKQNYRPDPTPLRIGYPPKWRLPSVSAGVSENPT